MSDETLVTLTADIAAAFVSNNNVAVGDVANLISSVHASLRGLGSDTTPTASQPLQPAVPVRSSIKPDYIVCLESGKKLKMLKRHLATNYNMTPDDYRAKWGLKSDYPMVAPNYAATRKELALKIGLGRKPKAGGTAAAAAPKTAAAPKPAAAGKTARSQTAAKSKAAAPATTGAPKPAAVKAAAAPKPAAKKATAPKKVAPEKAAAAPKKATAPKKPRKNAAPAN